MSASRAEIAQKWLERLVIVLVTVYFGAFLIWNARAPDVELTPWYTMAPREFPAGWVVAGSFVIGFLVAVVLTAIGALRRAAELRRARKRIESLEQELARVRNLPIEEDLHVPPAPEPELTDAENG